MEEVEPELGLTGRGVVSTGWGGEATSDGVRSLQALGTLWIFMNCLGSHKA